MAGMILISVLFATLAIPMLAARDPSPARGLRRAVLWIVLFHFAYEFSLLHVYSRLP